jgi:NADH-quinone oxidoreductase subunit I
MPYKLEPAATDLREGMYFPAVIRGIGALTKHFLKNLFFSRDPNPDILARPRGVPFASDNVTIQYPEEKQPYPPGYRGVHRLVPRVDGKPRCVACYMCATICPAQCIYIEAGEYPDDPIEKYPVRFIIDELRCIVCGFCVEACPKDAIRMDTGEHAPPSYERSAQIWDEKKLLRGPAVSYQYDPWLRRTSSLPAAELERLRAAARPFPSVATDEASQTPGFSVRALAAEAKSRTEDPAR